MTRPVLRPVWLYLLGGGALVAAAGCFGPHEVVLDGDEAEWDSCAGTSPAGECWEVTTTMVGGETAATTPGGTTTSIHWSCTRSPWALATATGIATGTITRTNTSTVTATATELPTLAAPAQLADECAALAPGVLVDGDLRVCYQPYSGLNRVRSRYYLEYCGVQQVQNGFDFCIDQPSPLAADRSASGCLEEVEAYLACLGNPNLSAVVDCDAQLPRSGCAVDTDLVALLPASLWCTTQQVEAEFDTLSFPVPGAESPLVVARGQLVTLWACPDENSYGFRCAAPSTDCETSCVCLRNSTPLDTVTVAVTPDGGFLREAWNACAFPEVPPEFVKKWEAALPALPPL